jgi:hypothetical protein
MGKVGLSGNLKKLNFLFIVLIKRGALISNKTHWDNQFIAYNERAAAKIIDKREKDDLIITRKANVLVLN